MSWPWVSRKRYEAVHQLWVVAGEATKTAYAERDQERVRYENMRLATIVQFEGDLEKARADHAAARAAGEECAHRLAECDRQRLDIKANFAKLAALSRALETKLRDCEDPPITRKELEKLTKLVAVLRTENEGLKKHVVRSDELAERLQERIRAVDQEAS